MATNLAEKIGNQVFFFLKIGKSMAARGAVTGPLKVSAELQCATAADSALPLAALPAAKLAKLPRGCSTCFSLS